MGVTVSESEVSDQLALYRYDRAQGTPFEGEAYDAPFVALIGHSRVTSADERWLMRLNLLALKLEQRRLREAEQRISSATVANYYAANKRRFVVPESRDLEVLSNYDRSVVSKARREIEGGADFIAVAKRMSTDPEAPKGLQLGLKRGTEERRYEHYVFGAKQGVLTGPQLETQYYLFKVLKIRRPKQKTLAESEAAIRQQLVARRRRQLADQWHSAGERIWVARTDCKSGYVVPKCRQYTGGSPA
jgi:parvulin-like peptidyl-prolyl isomerase